MDKLVLVIGGTRGTGLMIAQRLSAGGVAVRALARNPARAAKRLGDNVEVVPGDITKPDTLPPAMPRVTHIVFTAGCRSGFPARESTVRETEYFGVLNTLKAARDAGFRGRFLHMTASGVKRTSLFGAILNVYKGNTLRWRLKAEDAIRADGVDYTVIRAGVLINAKAGLHRIDMAQTAVPLSFRHFISRADVADGFVAALDHPRASRATFDIVWGPRGKPDPWERILDGLVSDASIPA